MPPLPHPEITEVWERADQGHANAYRCGADDGHSYYVKSQGATWRGLVCEWVTARLALAFGLPIAPFAQVRLDEQFAQFLQRSGNRHLVAGLAFGSRVAAPAREFEPTLLARCSTAFRRDLVAFDWWVHNADRTLGDYAGNPNLLWDTAGMQPVVIDHNMAFDAQFEPDKFADTHIFQADFAELRADWVMRADYEQRFALLVPLLSEIWSELPQNWLLTEDGDIRCAPSEFDSILARVHRPHFGIHRRRTTRHEASFCPLHPGSPAAAGGRGGIRQYRRGAGVPGDGLLWLPANSQATAGDAVF